MRKIWDKWSKVKVWDDQNHRYGRYGDESRKEERKIIGTVLAEVNLNKTFEMEGIRVLVRIIKNVINI